MTANAVTLTGVLLGTGAPPATLGGYTMAPLPADGSALGSMVSALPGLTFSEAVAHEKVGNGWATWSHGYTGDVYHTASSVNPTSLTVTLSSPVSAFDFYTEPVNFANFSFTATAQDGTTLTQTINGSSGAAGFGFYAPGNLITSVTITGTDVDGFAIGEFAVAVPEPGVMGLLGLFSLGLLWGRRQVRRGVRANETAS